MEKRRSDSPCDRCREKNCRGRCAAWESWFCRRWKRVRQIWGVEA